VTDITGKEHRVLLTQLSTVLSDKTRTAINSRIVLRDAVCAYVAAENANEMPLATVIQTVKEILRNAEQGASAASDELAQQLIDWCIEFHRTTSALTPKPIVLLS
jgi:predicted transcriptional regulator